MSTPISTAARFSPHPWAARARTLAAVYLLVLFAATHIPLESHGGPTHADKIVHYAAYASLTVLVLLGWRLTIGRLQARHYFAVWIAGTLYGVFDEVTQTPVGRTADVNDWAADVLGIVTGLLLFRVGSALIDWIQRKIAVG
jgi:VanZ family protein